MRIIDCSTGDETTHSGETGMISRVRIVVRTKGLNHGVSLVAEIHVDVHPAGLGNQVIGGVLGLYGLTLDACVRVIHGLTAIAVGVHLDRNIGNTGVVDPHTQADTVHTVGHVAKNLLLAGVEEVIIDPRAQIVSLRVIQTNAQRILTVSYVAAVLLGSQEHVGILMRSIRAFHAGIGQRRVSILIDLLIPCADRLLGVPVRDVAVLKVEQDVGALTEGQINGDRSDSVVVLVSRGKDGAGNSGIVSGGNGKAVNSTGSRGIYGTIKGSIGAIYVVIAVLHQILQTSGSAVGHSGLVQREGNLGRIHDMNGLGTHDRAVMDHLNIHVAQSAVGHKGAVCDGTEALIGQLPAHVFRNLCGRVGCVGTDCGEGIGGMGNEIIVVTLDQGMVKDTGRHCGGNDHQSVGNRTLTAAGGRVDQSELVLTLANGTKGGRVTAIQVNCLNASKLKHDLGLLLNSNTNSRGSLATVGSHENELAVGGQTEGLAGIQGGLIKTAYHRAILDQVNVTLDSFLDLALVLGILSLSTDHVGTVLQHSEEGVAVTVGTGNIPSFHDENAKRLTGIDVVVSRVDTRNHLEGLGLVCLQGSNLSTQGLHAVDSILVVHVVSHDLNRVESRVNSRDIHLNAFVSAVMQNQLVHGNTGSQSGLVVVDHREVRVIQRVIHRSGKDRYGQNCTKHHNCQHHRNDLFHFFFSFSFLYKIAKAILYREWMNRRCGSKGGRKSHDSVRIAFLIKSAA